MFRFLGAAALAALLAAGASAGEAEPQKPPGADFQPGKLKLALTVTERSGVERKGAAVTSGVPFPPGFLPDAGRLAVIDEAGKPVVCQAAAMNKWWKPVYDDSVQWALVSFLADVPANGRKTYYLVDDGKTASPASPLKVVKSDKEISIETGAARFTVPLEGEALLASASVGGKNVLGAKGLQCVITTGDWPDRSLKAGDKHLAAHDAKGVAVEESGAARVVVAVKGQFKPGDKDGKLYGFTARLYFEAGSASVRVIQTISNGRLDPKLEGGWRYVYTWPIEDASLLADLALGEKAAVSTPCEGKAVAAEKELVVYQDSSGGNNWQKYAGAAFRGYKATEGEKELAAGNSHSGVMSVAGEGLGVSAALRNFRVEFPHALAGSAKQLRIGLFPGEFAEPFPINGGQRKSWDLRLTFFAGAAPDPKGEFAVGDALLLFRPDPAWMVRSAAAGCWPYGMGLLPDPKGGKPALRRDNASLDVGGAGWDRYGVVGDWNSGGHHWNEESMYIPWVLWGDGANFDRIEASSLWSSELVGFNWDDPDLAAFYLMLMQWNDHENRVKRVAYPGYKNHDGWGVPDSGHMGMVIMHEYYYLTGDRRAREAVEHLGNNSRTVLWKFNHDDKTDGTGPMGGPVGWCKRQDADADPNFKLDTRYIGWPLFNLANAYRLTGDAQVLAECRNVAHAFRNTARYSPIGFMVLQINSKGSKDVYGGQGPFAKYRDLSASQCYAHFQEALMCHGLWEYYLMSRDIEALDPMIGFADLMTHHCMLKDPEGKRAGWTYAFGDYWGPYTWEDRGTDKRVGWSDWHYNVVETMGWVAVLTGRPDYVEVCRDATAIYGKGFDVAAAVMATGHRMEPPPAAVTDLKAEALGGGKVKLTWTAPGGPARAARYQVKWSAAKIVERVSGWPDRTEPLPANKAEWEARAAAFNAKQRAFWAANNLAGAPAPGAAGKKESLEAAGLPAGKLNFALKSWGAADSMSDLSNVVEFEVK